MLSIRSIEELLVLAYDEEEDEEGKPHNNNMIRQQVTPQHIYTDVFHSLEYSMYFLSLRPYPQNPTVSSTSLHQQFPNRHLIYQLCFMSVEKTR
jgi:hypothetical protein